MSQPRLKTIVLIRLALITAACSEVSQPADNFFLSDDVRLRYQVVGRGPTVVLLHGFGETLYQWTTTGVTHALSPEFQVVLLDLRGHGRSAKPVTREAYGRQLAADVVRLLDTIGSPRAHVVGYSLGALVALDAAISYPERVLSLAMAGSGAHEPGVQRDFQSQAQALERNPGVNRVDSAALAALLREIQLASDQDIQALEPPVAVLIGSLDRFLSSAHRLAHLLPITEVMVIEGADHATVLRDPEFIEGLRGFLRKHD